MAKKIVRYNGGTQYYYPCTKPDKLILGQEYEVLHAKVSDCHTEYTLKGVEGEFNSVWFDDVETIVFPNTFLAVSHNIPEEGKKYECARLERIGYAWKLVDVLTSTVQKVEQIAENTYRVTTRNSVYITEVK